MSEPIPINTELAVPEPSQADAQRRPLEPIEGEFREVPPQRFRDQLHVLYKHRWLAAGAFAACIAAAAVITAMTPRTYTASTRIHVSRTSPIKLQLKDNVLDLEETERILNGASSFLSTQLQALKSRDVAERAIRQFHLAENPLFAEPAPNGSALAAMGVSLPSFLQPRGLNEPIAADAPIEPAAGPVDPVLIDRYMGYLTVEDLRGTDLLDIRFTAPNPTLAAFLAGAHVQAYLGTVKESQVATDSTAIAFLGEQLVEARRRTEQAETALAEFSAAHPTVAVNQEDQLIGKQITDLSAQLGGAEARRATAQSRYEFLSKARNDPLTHVIEENSSLAKLRLSLIDTQAQQAALKQRLGPNHTQMRELRRQETEIRLQLDNEVRQEIGAAKARLREAQLHEDRLQKRLAEREKEASQLRALGGQYEMLKGEAETARLLHASLLKQKTDTAIHSELATSRVRVIERPEVPRVQTRPRAKVNLMFGAVCGLVLAIGAAFFRESLDNSVKSSEHAEGLLQLPTLAIVPNFTLARATRKKRLLQQRRGGDGAGNGLPAPTSPTHPLVVQHDPHSPVAEIFRMLRTALVLSSNGHRSQVILITSAAAGEGKTVTALNLAATLAEAGHRVLLADVDLRHPGCHEVLGTHLRPGLSSFLAGEVDLARIVRDLSAPRLSFISAGPRPLNPAELVGSDRMREALAVLRAHYDYIILDSPPVLPVTDAVLLARQADGVLLVMKGQTAPSELVRRARDQLIFAGARMLGIVVNNVDRSWGDYRFYDAYPHYHSMPRTPGGDAGMRTTQA